MNEQDDFFSPNHLRLLSIATWAKYLAWVILIVYILWVVLLIVQDFLNNKGQFQQNVWLLAQFRLGLSLSTTLLRGVIYYLILKGISLGLHMIVETDINYREKREVHNEQ